MSARQESNADAAIRLDVPHLLLRLPVSAPPAHPDTHPSEELAGGFSDYTRRPGGAFAERNQAGEPEALPMTTCTASGVALYLAADGGDASNISRRLPVLLLPSLRLATTAVAGQAEAEQQPKADQKQAAEQKQEAEQEWEAGESSRWQADQQAEQSVLSGAPGWQPAAYSLEVGPMEAAIQPGQLHMALAAAAAAGQDWVRICGGYANAAQPDTVSSQLGGADLLSQASADGSAASAPAALIGPQGGATDELSAAAESAALPATAGEAVAAAAGAATEGQTDADVAAAAVADALPDSPPDAASPAAALPAGKLPQGVLLQLPAAGNVGGAAPAALSEAGSSGGESPSAARQAAEQALGFSETDRWSLTAQLPRCGQLLTTSRYCCHCPAA